VHLEGETPGRVIVIKLQPSKEENGRTIVRGGITMLATPTLLENIATKEGRRTSLRILE